MSVCQARCWAHGGTEMSKNRGCPLRSTTLRAPLRHPIFEPPPHPCGMCALGIPCFYRPRPQAPETFSNSRPAVQRDVAGPGPVGPQRLNSRALGGPVPRSEGVPSVCPPGEAPRGWFSSYKLDASAGGCQGGEGPGRREHVCVCSSCRAGRTGLTVITNSAGTHTQRAGTHPCLMPTAVSSFHPPLYPCIAPMSVLEAVFSPL